MSYLDSFIGNGRLERKLKKMKTIKEIREQAKFITIEQAQNELDQMFSQDIAFETTASKVQQLEQSMNEEIETKKAAAVVDLEPYKLQAKQLKEDCSSKIWESLAIEDAVHFAMQDYDFAQQKANAIVNTFNKHVR